MTIFAVLEQSPNTKLSKAIKSQFSDDYLMVATGQWLISANGTAQSISDKLGLHKGTGINSTLVFATSSYYGLHNSDTWDWIKNKLESNT